MSALLVVRVEAVVGVRGNQIPNRKQKTEAEASGASPFLLCVSTQWKITERTQQEGGF